jgi:phosphate transport system substrate-binding protein
MNRYTESRKLAPYIAIGIALSLGLESCNKTTTPEVKQQKLTISGASTIAPLVSNLGKRFEQQHPGTHIDVQTGGTARGLADTSQGLADIGMVSRALKPEEKEGMAVFLIAMDGISIIVHTDNPVKEINSKQVVGIYTRKINNWKEIGGKDSTITLVHKAEGRSTLERFLEYFHIDNKSIKPDVVIGDDQQGIKTVAGNPNAIGYVSIGSAESDISQGAKLKLLPLDGVAATTDKVKDKTFPLLRELNLVTKGEPKGIVKEFIEFAQDNKNNDIITEEHFVPAKN